MARTTKEFHYTLTAHDLKRLLDGEILIAEEDGLADFAAIRISAAWSRASIRNAKALRDAFKEEDWSHVLKWAAKRKRTEKTLDKQGSIHSWDIKEGD